MWAGSIRAPLTALYRLERDGFVDSEWDASAARRRRVYLITPAGAGVLAARRRDWGDFARGMRAVLGSGAAEELG
jgi:PadR family transcriptional regulator PadR